MEKALLHFYELPQSKINNYYPYVMLLNQTIEKL